MFNNLKIEISKDASLQIEGWLDTIFLDRNLTQTYEQTNFIFLLFSHINSLNSVRNLITIGFNYAKTKGISDSHVFDQSISSEHGGGYYLGSLKFAPNTENTIVYSLQNKAGNPIHIVFAKNDSAGAFLYFRKKPKFKTALITLERYTNNSQESMMVGLLKTNSKYVFLIPAIGLCIECDLHVDLATVWGKLEQYPFWNQCWGINERRQDPYYKMVIYSS